MFYVVPSGEDLEQGKHLETQSLDAARQYAERSRKMNGKHYRIVEIRNVWNTWLDEPNAISKIIG